LGDFEFIKANEENRSQDRNYYCKLSFCLILISTHRGLLRASQIPQLVAAQLSWWQYKSFQRKHFLNVKSKVDPKLDLRDHSSRKL